MPRARTETRRTFPHSAMHCAGAHDAQAALALLRVTSPSSPGLCLCMHVCAIHFWCSSMQVVSSSTARRFVRMVLQDLGSAAYLCHRCPVGAASTCWSLAMGWNA